MSAEKKAEWKPPSGRVVPAINEAIAPGRETVKVTLTKREGTPVDLLMKKPQRGGTIRLFGPDTIVTWDEVTTPPVVRGAVYGHDP